MLAGAHRLRSSVGFTRAVRRGVKRARPAVVVHAYDTARPTPTQVGFIVAKPVGNAVVRNRVKRRLRHLVAAYLATTPDGLEIVVRANTAAVTRPDRLSGDLQAAWTQALAAVAPAEGTVEGSVPSVRPTVGAVAS